MRATLALITLLTALTSQSAWAEVSRWTTEFGPLELDVTTGDRVTGAFPKFNGHFFGVLDRGANAVNGTWTQPRSEVECAVDVGGSKYWGRVTWWLGANGALTGQWSFCDQPAGSGGRWTGRLDGGVHPLEVATIDEGEPPPEEAAVEAAGAGDGAGDREAMAAATAVWNKAVDPSRLKALRGDVTCDGVPDLVLTHLDRESAEGPFLSVAVVAGGRPPAKAPATYFDFTGLAFTSLCGDPKMVDSALRAVAPNVAADLTGFPAPPLCHKGVRLDDGQCDAVWVFTNPNGGGTFDLIVGRN